MIENGVKLLHSQRVSFWDKFYSFYIYLSIVYLDGHKYYINYYYIVPHYRISWIDELLCMDIFCNKTFIRKVVFHCKFLQHPDVLLHDKYTPFSLQEIRKFTSISTKGSLHAMSSHVCLLLIILWLSIFNFCLCLLTILYVY